MIEIQPHIVAAGANCIVGFTSPARRACYRYGRISFGEEIKRYAVLVKPFTHKWLSPFIALWAARNLLRFYLPLGTNGYEKTKDGLLKLSAEYRAVGNPTITPPHIQPE